MIINCWIVTFLFTCDVYPRKIVLHFSRNNVNYWGGRDWSHIPHYLLLLLLVVAILSDYFIWPSCDQLPPPLSCSPPPCPHILAIRWHPAQQTAGIVVTEYYTELLLLPAAVHNFKLLNRISKYSSWTMENMKRPRGGAAASWARRKVWGLVQHQVQAATGAA